MVKKFEFVVLMLSIAFLAVRLYLTKKGNIPYIRKIAALESMEDLVGRSAEMGSTILFDIGCASLTGWESATGVGGLSVLSHVVELCGKYEVPIYVPTSQAIAIPILEDMLKSGYAKGGHPELYNKKMINFVGGAYALYSELNRYLLEEKPAVNMLYGGLQYECLVSMGAGAVAGCIQTAGTPRMYYQPFLAACCDYAMIGDELYAAAASIGQNEEDLGILAGQDFIKMLGVILIIISVISYSAGFGDVFSNMLGW